MPAHFILWLLSDQNILICSMAGGCKTSSVWSDALTASITVTLRTEADDMLTITSRKMPYVSQYWSAETPCTGRNISSLTVLWCSELSSGLYCRVKWLSTDVSEVRTASIIRDDRQSFYTAVQPRRQLWTSYSPPWELEISYCVTYPVSSLVVCSNFCTDKSLLSLCSLHYYHHHHQWLYSPRKDLDRLTREVS
jgi:hypothetical protein